jgi:hypothetical protein
MPILKQAQKHHGGDHTQMHTHMKDALLADNV